MARMELAARFEGRRASVLDDLSANHACHALLVTGPANVRYLSGFTGSHGTLLLLPGRAELLTDFRYLEQARSECPGIEVVDERVSKQAGVRRGLAQLPQVALESEHLTLADWQTLTAEHESARLISTRGIVESVRTRKDDDEIATIDRACQIAESALRETLEAVVVGQTERQLALELETQMRQRGADGPAFPSIVASGPHSSIPHHNPTDRPLAAGDLLKIDFGALVDGYHSDITRTFVVAAEPTGWQIEIHGLVNRAAAAGRACLRPGLSVAELDSVVRGMITDAGFGSNFGHGLGHGVGLQIHEAPIMGPKSTGTLESAMTITVEPGVYLPKRGGVRIEDTVVVGPDGCRSLTTLDRDLLRVA